MLCASAVSQAQNARIVLRWKDVPGASAYELQIAKDPAFVEVVLQTRTTTAGYRWEQLPSTTHWWRVRSFDAESRASEWSQPRTIAVDSAIPTPIEPAEGAAVSCGATVSFQLEPVVVVKEYVLELSGSADFTSFRTLRSPTPSFEVPGLSAGSWWWRTRGVDLKSRTSAAGPVRALRVVVSAPRLKAAGDVPLGTPQVQLTWSEVGCAKSYLVEATHDGRDKVSVPASGSSLAFKAGVAGEYRWRVASVDERGAAGEFSGESVFRVRLPSPNGRSERGGLRPELSWNAVPSATSYKLELQRLGGKSPEAVASPTVSGTSWRAPELPPGQYQWRVTARDALGHTSLPSEYRGFVRAAGAPLALAEWRTPESDVVVSVGAEVELEWSGVPEARVYEVELDEVVTKAARLSFKTPALAEGPHVVRVRAVGDGFRMSEWSAPLELYAGIPPVERLEVALVGEQVRVRLLDARGRPVEDAQPRFTVRTGALASAEFKDGSWQANWSPPPSGSDVLVVDERSFHAEHPLEAARDPFFSIAARLGGVFNGGAVASPAVQVGFTARLPLLRRQLGVELRVGGYGAASRLDLGGAVLEGQATLLPLGLLAAWHQNLGAFQLKGGVGPVLQLAWVQVGPDAAFSVLPGLEVVVALSRRVGPGRVEVEVSYLGARLDSPLARLNAPLFVTTFLCSRLKNIYWALLASHTCTSTAALCS